MASSTNTLEWSAQLRVAASSRHLVGDKINLPQSALEGLLAAAPVETVEHSSGRNATSTFDPFNPFSFAAETQARHTFADHQQRLPHPLTFRLVNPANGRTVYAGIREFSAEPDQLQLSPFLRNALGLPTAPSEQSTRESTPNGVEPTSDTITVHAKQLPKGTYVKLRPLEAGYDPEDWKALLERYLRDNFTTLTTGEILEVSASRHEKFRFLVDKFEPDTDAICVIDTDLEVDIEPLNEEQARETLAKRLAKRQRAPGTQAGSSTGGSIELPVEATGQVLNGEYVDYSLHNWNRSKDIIIDLSTENEVLGLDILVNPMSAHQRSLPRVDAHVFADLSGRSAKRLKLSHRNIDIEEAETLAISVSAWKPDDNELDKDNSPLSFSIKMTQDDEMEVDDAKRELSPDEVVCKNCRQHIPKRTLPLHEAFCYRNNVSCPQCFGVFLKNSEAWKTHWHCPHDDDFGNGDVARNKHDSIFHPNTPLQCPNCDFEAFDLTILAQHRTTTCPAKEILCQFCHLVVPQQGLDDPSFTDPEVLLSGLTPHELTDGARTTECHLCGKFVRLRDMKTHLGLHDRDRVAQTKPSTCSNNMCKRTLRTNDLQRIRREQLGLCNEDFAPFYNTSFDPEGKARRRRVERRLLQQLMGGCGKSWCNNKDWCRTGRQNVMGADRVLSAKDALPLVKPVLERLDRNDASALFLCVDEATQGRRAAAEILAELGEYETEWCMKALEESKGEISGAQSWLNDHAPKAGETLAR
jgi:hypothetical protein